MKERNKICITLILALLSLGLYAQDIFSPQIKVITPQEGITLYVGNNIDFQMEASDNEALDYYQVNIDPADPEDEYVGEDLSEEIVMKYERKWALTGKESKVRQSFIVIPENTIRGNYKFRVLCKDKAGNETNITRNIVVAPAPYE